MKKIIAIGIAAVIIIGGIVFARIKMQPKSNDVKLDKPMTEKNIRQPTAAGTFYPDNATELRNKINTLLSSSNVQMINDQMVNILIVPHAGYEYSGSVAAAGFKQIEKADYDRVILLGASHQSYFEGVAVDENTSWKTPLGSVDIDLVTAQKIVDADENFNFNSQAHAQEHSLEVELPFLQIVLDDFKIVPVLIGQPPKRNEVPSGQPPSWLEQLSSAIYKNLTPNTLILISTDLSHYPSYDIANSVDERTINAILAGDPEKFENKVNDQLAQNYPNLDTVACGEKAIKTGMIIAEELAEENLQGSGAADSLEVGAWKLIKYANSGDAVGEKSRVVGYGALAYSSKHVTSNTIQEKQELNQVQKKKLIEVARQTLETYINEGKKPNFNVTDPALGESNSPLREKLGVFVTLRKDGQLRGCMGEFSPTTPLWQTVIDRTVVAATKDPRFPPVKSVELDDIAIEISVLSKPESVNDWQEIELGKHGVIVKKGNRAGTYLPQVGVEHDWKNLEEFLSHLCANKAGLPVDCYKDPDTELQIYTADVFGE